MEIGLLWYDGDPRRALEDKIGRAARRYREKFGRWPNTCYVHRQAVEAACQVRLADRAAIRVLPAANILRHHFWLGEEVKGRRSGARSASPTPARPPSRRS